MNAYLKLNNCFTTAPSKLEKKLHTCLFVALIARQEFLTWAEDSQKSEQ